MSNEFAIDISKKLLEQGYTVKTICDCRIITGAVPLNDLPMFLHGYSKNAVMAVDIANRIGATFVIGEPDAIKRLRIANLPASDNRIRDAQIAINKGLPVDVIEWLQNGERGRSSDAMCQAIFGVPNDNPIISHHATRMILGVVCCFLIQCPKRTSGE